MSDERRHFTWSEIRVLLLDGKSLDALMDARRHLVHFVRERGARVGRGNGKGRVEFGLPNAIRGLAEKGLISNEQRRNLIWAIDIRNDEVHGSDQPSDEDRIKAVNIIGRVCAPDEYRSVEPQEIKERGQAGSVPERFQIDGIRRRIEELQQELDRTSILENPLRVVELKYLLANEAERWLHARDPEGYRKEKERAEEERKVVREENERRERAKRELEAQEASELRAIEQEAERRRRSKVLLLLSPVALIAGFGMPSFLHRLWKKIDRVEPNGIALAADASPSHPGRDSDIDVIYRLVVNRTGVGWVGERGWNDDKLCEQAHENMSSFTSSEWRTVAEHCGSHWEGLHPPDAATQIGDEALRRDPPSKPEPHMSRPTPTRTAKALAGIDGFDSAQGSEPELEAWKIDTLMAATPAADLAILRSFATTKRGLYILLCARYFEKPIDKFDPIAFELSFDCIDYSECSLSTRPKCPGVLPTFWHSPYDTTQRLFDQ